MCIEKSFDTIFNMASVSGKSPMAERVNMLSWYKQPIYGEHCVLLSMAAYYIIIFFTFPFFAFLQLASREI